MKSELILFSLLLLIDFRLFSQNNSTTKFLTLDEVIQLANQQSPDALLAKNEFKNKYWQYRTYKAAYRPSLNLETTLPDLNRSISSLTLPDGSDAFIERSSVFSSTNLSLEQAIGLTGGSIYFNTGLQRIDNILSDSTITSYLSTPFIVGIRQPIFAFNNLYWQKKIDPIKYEEAKRKYVEDIEQLAIKAVNYFFELYLAQINLEIAELNLINNDTLYKISQGRYNLGKIAENELLQMELSVLNANITLEQAKLDVEKSIFDLKSFLRIKETDKIELNPPEKLPVFNVDLTVAVEQAKKNREAILTFERKKWEAKMEVAKAKAGRRFNANIFATYGLTQSALDFSDAYANPQDQQQFRVGLQVPLLDWGRSKAVLEMAKANQELITTTIEQEEIDFEREIFIKAMQFNMQRNQLVIAEKSDTIALKRYEVTKQRYLIGKIDITDLNIALKEKDLARQGFVEALRNYWVSYFTIRKLTHYDFEKNQPISFDTSTLFKN